MYPTIVVSVLYKNQPLGKKYFDEHPEIHPMYPTQEQFYRVYMPAYDRLIQLKEPQFIEISENSIRVNGQSIVIN